MVHKPEGCDEYNLIDIRHSFLLHRRLLFLRLFKSDMCVDESAGSPEITSVQI